MKLIRLLHKFEYLLKRTTPVIEVAAVYKLYISCRLNHTIIVVEVGDKCEMLGSGSGNNGRLPGKSRGCVEFSKLNVAVS